MKSLNFLALDTDVEDALTSILRWHYYKKADAMNWDQSTAGVGLPDDLAGKLENSLPSTIVSQLATEGQVWADYEIARVDKVSWSEVLIMAFPQEYRDTYYPIELARC